MVWISFERPGSPGRTQTRADVLGAGEFKLFYKAARPPSMTNCAPVMYADSSDAR